jgi:hypothetical protein
MATTPPSQFDPASLSVQELMYLRKELVAQALVDQQMERQKQLREDAEFAKQLDTKNLKELMQLQKQQQEEAERNATALNAIKSGDMSAVEPYMKAGCFALTEDKKGENEWELIKPEDLDRIVAVGREKHIRDDVPAAFTTSMDYVKEGQDPAQKLEDTKKWLQNTFSTRPTDAILVKDRDGDYVIVSLGVCDEEIKAARDLQTAKSRAEEKSAQVTTRIQQKIQEGPQKTAAPAPDETATALATPVVQRESQGPAPAHRT